MSIYAWELNIPENNNIEIRCGNALNQFGVVSMIVDAGSCPDCKYVEDEYISNAKDKSFVIIPASSQKQILLFTAYYVDISGGDTKKLELKVTATGENAWDIESINLPEGVSKFTANCTIYSA